MKKWGAALVVFAFILAAVWGPHRSEPVRMVPIDEEATRAIDETGDLLVASEYQVFSVNSQTGSSQRILQTEEPIGSLGYTADHTVITVYNSNSPKAFHGFYLKDKQSDGFVQLATPHMSPKFCYIYGDSMFVSDADKTVQKNGEMTRVGIYQLKERKWAKEWFVPGGVEDVKGNGKEVYFVTSNNADTSSNLYKADLLTGDWGKMIQEARRYPLDLVSVDSNGDVYMGISQRVKTEWSNKIYKYNPGQLPYELTSNFVSNTKPFFFTMEALKGKMLIMRFDLTDKVVDMERPLALLDLTSRKQMHLTWDHRPVDAVTLEDGFAVLAEDGTLAFVALNAVDQPTREQQIPELTDGGRLAVKK